MMEPAQGYQVVGVMVAAVGPLDDVVGLEPVADVASFDRTFVVVPPLHVSSDRAGDGLSHVGIGEGVEAVGDDHPDLAGAENLRQSVRSDSRSGRDGSSGLSQGGGG